MEEKELTEKDSLLLIQQMIGKARNSIIEKGTWPIYWGALITFCSLFTFVEIKTGKVIIPFSIFWLTLPALVIQIGIIIYQKSKNNSKPKSVGLSQKAIQYVWIAFTVSMILVPFSPTGNSPIVYFVLYGIPTFVTGGVVNFRPFTIGGIICWICALITIIFKVESSYNLLLVAVCAISAWLVPGIILRRRYLGMKKAGNV